MQQIFFDLLQKSNASYVNFLSCIEQIMAFIIPMITNFIFAVLSQLMDKLAFIFYFIAKFVLLAVDIIFSYIQRLCGLNMDFSSFDKVFSTESDVVFNLLYTAKDAIAPIMQNLVALAIFMIIVFTIIALIKAQFNSLSSKKPALVMDVLKKTIKAFLLLFITPMFALFGIVCSNLLLQSLYKATSKSGSTSLGTQIFSASAATANNFRIYAENGKRIPITCDFSREKEIINYYKGKPPTDKFAAYVNGSQNLIYTTGMMFQNGEFINFGEINEDTYYMSYDVNNGGSKGYYAQYRKLDINVEQYYVMADVVDYAVSTNDRFYIKTIEQVLDDIVKKVTNTTERESILKNLFQKFKITLHGASLENDKKIADYDTEDLVSKYSNKSWSAISYIALYNSTSGTTSSKQHVHIKGATDEYNGAKFIIATKKLSSTNSEYLDPLYIGRTGGYNNSFYSDYLSTGCLVTAKGFMISAQYPTAIRLSHDGSQVVCYRHDFMSGMSGDVNSLAKFNFGTTASKNPFAALISLFKMFFNPEDSVDGALDVNPGALNLSYDTKEQTSIKITDGEFKLGYFMGYSDISAVGVLKENISVLTLFSSKKFNLLLLFAAPIILIKVAFVSFLGLIQRSYELFLIIIFYPAAVITIPIEDNGYNNWVQTFTNKLFATYGFILGINFVLMLFPIITELEYFTQADIARNKVAYKVCNMFFGGTIYNMAKMLNVVTGILFQLVALTLLDSKKDGGGVPEMINQMMKSDGDLSSDAAENFAKAVKAIKTGLKIIGGIVKTIMKAIPQTSSQTNSADGVSKVEARARRLREYKEFWRKLMPGGKIRERIVEKKAMDKDKKKVDEAKKKLQEELEKENEKTDVGEKPGPDASPEQQKEYEEKVAKRKQEDEAEAKAVEEAFKQMIDAEKQKTKAMQDPEGNRQAKEEHSIQNKLTGISEEDEENAEREKDAENGDGDEDGDNNREGGEGGEGEEESEESYMTDDELDKREREIKKKMGFMSDVELSDDKRHDNASQRAVRNKMEKYQKELERIRKEKEKREEEGLQEDDIHENIAERNQLLQRKEAGEELSDEDEKRLKDLERAFARNTKEGRKKHREDVKKKEEEKQLDNARMHEHEEKKSEDEKLFTNKNTTDAQIQQRLMEATQNHQAAAQNVQKILESHPEWNLSGDGLAGKSQEELQKILGYMKDKGASAEEIQQMKRLQDSLNENGNLMRLMGQRERTKQTQRSDELRKKNGDARSQAGRTGKKHDELATEINRDAVEAEQNLAAVTEELAELEKQAADDPMNLVLRQKVIELQAKKDEYDKALKRRDDWENMDNEDTRKAYDQEQEAKKEDDKLRRQAEKHFKSLNKAYREEDIQRWIAFHKNPNALENHNKRDEELTRIIGNSMSMSGIHSKHEGMFRFADKVMGHEKTRQKAMDDLEKLHSKTMQEIQGVDGSDHLYYIGGKKFTLDQMNAQMLQAYMQQTYGGDKPLSGQDVNRRLLLQDLLKQKQALEHIGTMAIEQKKKQEEMKPKIKQYVKDHWDDE